MIKQIVANGCSYMDEYCQGLGHVDLGNRLGIYKAQKLALTGCANDRIIRSTLKHSYATEIPTLYIIGITFMSRWELPINDNGTAFEGRWINPQAIYSKVKWQPWWTEADTITFKDLKFKSVSLAEPDQLEDLMYRLISMLHDLRSRGHQAVIYNQADAAIPELTKDSKFELLFSEPSFVNALNWLAIPWQQQQGATTKTYPLGDKPPPEFRHILRGNHSYLNTYLTNYIQEHKILA